MLCDLYTPYARALKCLYRSGHALYPKRSYSSLFFSSTDNLGCKQLLFIERPPPNCRVPNFNLPRSLWTALNQTRTKKDRCQYFLHKQGLSRTQNWECASVTPLKLVSNITFFKDDLEKLHATGGSTECVCDKYLTGLMNQ